MVGLPDRLVVGLVGCLFGLLAIHGDVTLVISLGVSIKISDHHLVLNKRVVTRHDETCRANECQAKC